MENLDHKEQARDGVGLNDSTTRSSGASITHLLHGSSSDNALSGNTFGTCLPFERSNNNFQYNNSAHAVAGNANSYRRRRMSSSSPYGMFHEALPVDHAAERSKGASSSKPKVPLYRSQAPPAIDEPKLIENIADTLSPSKVTHLLFQGHENENIALPLLNPNIGSNVSSQDLQNDNVIGHQLPPRPPQVVIDLRTSCIYCFQTVSNGNSTTVSKRSCGHYFHNNCFHLQSEPMKGQHIWNSDCQFCKLETH